MAKGEQRSAARLAAVQALYQMDIAGTSLPDTLAEFESHWMGKVVDGDEYKPAEAAFFRDLVGGVLKQQRTLDPLIDQTLQAGWPLKRVEAIMRAILRSGAFELGKRKDVPVKVVISEYVDIAHAFFDRDEAGMVNAVLDAIARNVRAEDLAKG
ncbi:N utilization substance protein B [Methylopila capsulata]|uniref:Transcription antitermination protein NusB n=1 Tax=Methylopila capsulata TaxID=61654 RepID=A0A9W6MS19_9HYPH|nr:MULTISPECIES: transcription antitermination factor NusB [Methylopila]MBM7850547.1 N utilization substance protein B [Methylopila capsulata]GLK55843.1 N utilization substance protein B [Methylopila capsulata]